MRCAECGIGHDGDHPPWDASTQFIPHSALRTRGFDMDLVWLCLLFPLAGFGINALLGRWLPKRAHGWIATLAMLAAFVVAWFVLADLLSLALEDQHPYLILYNWVPVDGFNAAFGAWLDPLSVLMLLIV